MGQMWFYRTFLGAAYKRDYRVPWRRALFVARLDPDYAIWEGWVKRDFKYISRTFFSPYITPKQAREGAFKCLVNLRIDQERVIMAKQQRTNGSTSTVSVDFWVNTRLDDHDKLEIEAARPTMEHILADFGSLVFQGYRLSAVPDRFSDSIQASLVCVEQGNPNAGCGVSARHPDLDTALVYLLYKVNKMGDTCWREFAPPPREEQWG